MKLQIAKKEQVKLRIGISGASGFGKTYSALLLAYGITDDWTKIAIIDTENNSASLYAHLGDFNVLQLNEPYSPERYIEAIRMCEKASVEVLIIDSMTHEWQGKGGEQNEDLQAIVGLFFILDSQKLS
ncbi:MAG: AAA family ATPase [Flavobacteriaceae bacterium]|nr:AAA family ATPase [Flavobacteriaceae bacterium]